MAELSWSKALNAQRSFLHLNETGSEGVAREAWHRYCDAPTPEGATVLLNAVRALPIDTARNLQAEMGV